MTAALALFTLLSSCALKGAHLMATQEFDRLKLPADSEEFSSPSGQFVLVVQSLDGWKTAKSEATLFRVSGNERGRLWTRRLPHAYRPRFCFVSREGHVVLLDEWVNVLTPLAVMVIDSEGRTIAQYGFKDVETILSVPSSRIVAMAKYGSWMSTRPILDDAGKSVTVQSAGKTLRIDVRSGHMSIEPSAR